MASFQQVFWVLVFPLLNVMVFSLGLLATGFYDLPVIVSLLGTVLVVGGALVYIVFRLEETLAGRSLDRSFGARGHVLSSIISRIGVAVSSNGHRFLY